MSSTACTTRAVASTAPMRSNRATSKRGQRFVAGVVVLGLVQRDVDLIAYLERALCPLQNRLSEK